MPKEQNISLVDYLSQMATEGTQNAGQLLEEAGLVLKSGELTDSQKKTEAASRTQTEVISINTAIGIVNAKIGEIRREISKRDLKIPEGYTIDIILKLEIPTQSQSPAHTTTEELSTSGRRIIESIPMERLNLSVRAHNVLKRAGFQTIGDIKAKSDDELLSIRNFGRGSFNELIEKLTERGFRGEKS